MFLRVTFSEIIFSLFFQHDAQKHDVGTPFGTQFGPKWRPNRQVAPKGPKKASVLLIVEGPGTNLLPESIPIES